MQISVSGPLEQACKLLARTSVPVRSLLAAGVLLLLLFVVIGEMRAALVSLALTVALAAQALWREYIARGASGTAAASPESVSVSAGDAVVHRVLAALPDAALALDRNGTIVAVNEAASALFPSAIGRNIALVVREPALLAAIAEASSSGATLDIQCSLPPPIDQTLAARIAPLHPVAPQTDAALMVLLRDASEQERLTRMRADFVANASHELRTPLASLKGFIETLQGAAREDAKARDQFLGIMQEQATRMARLIDDLLSLSRVEMREHMPPQGTAELGLIIDEVCKVLGPMADKAGIRIEIGELARPGVAVGDKDELTQVVHNLVQNAIKYGRHGGKIVLSTQRAGGRLELAVADDGIGIASEHMPRLTERFYRVNAKESRERGGTGLGLAIVKHIVSRHRGQLRIDSSLGKGSTFRVLLPAAAPTERSS